MEFQRERFLIYGRALGYGLVINFLLALLSIFLLVTAVPFIYLLSLISELLRVFYGAKPLFSRQCSSSSLREIERKALVKIQEEANHNFSFHVESFMITISCGKNGPVDVGAHSVVYTPTRKNTEEKKESIPSSNHILIIHGANSGPLYFSHLIHPLITKGFEVRSISLPGFGEAKIPLEVLSWQPQEILDLYNKFLAKYVTTVYGNILPIVIGHSFGGFLVASAASCSPHLFSKVVLVNAVGLLPTLDDVGMYWAFIFKLGIPNFVVKNVFGSVFNILIFNCFQAFGITSAKSHWDIAQMSCSESVGEIIISKFITLHVSSSYWNTPLLGKIFRDGASSISLVWGMDDNIVPAHVAHLFKNLLSASLGANVKLILIDKGWHNPAVVHGGQHFLAALDFIFSSDDEPKIINPNSKMASSVNEILNYGFSTLSTDDTKSNIEGMYSDLYTLCGGSKGDLSHTYFVALSKDGTIPEIVAAHTVESIVLDRLVLQT